MNKKSVVLILAGPTASGKTEVSLEIAHRIDAEIISADSVQVYKHLDIGSDKVSVNIRKKIPHYLIDVVFPDEQFNVKQFIDETEKAIVQIINKNKTPVIVGGTGLYIKGLVEGLCKAPGSNRELREKLYKIADKYGDEVLYKRLAKIDPIIADKIHPHNRVRIVRALEVYYLTKKPFSYWQRFTTQRIGLDVKWKIFCFKWQRDILYKRIEGRVDRLIDKGWIEEVRNILKEGYSPNLKSLKSLGYKQIVEYIVENKYTKEVLIKKIKALTKNYAKRQFTWFKKQKNIDWIEMSEHKDYSQVANEILRRAFIYKPLS